MTPVVMVRGKLIDDLQRSIPKCKVIGFDRALTPIGHGFDYRRSAIFDEIIEAGR